MVFRAVCDGGIKFETLLKEVLQHKRFPVNFADFFRTAFL